MRRARLWRSTPFRLALLFSLFFVAAFSASGLVAVQAARRHLFESLDGSVASTYATLASAHMLDGDAEDLVQAVEGRARLAQPPHADEVFLLLGPDGTRLGGNIETAAVAEGASTVSGAALGRPEENRFRLFAGDLGGSRLVVGRSFAEIDEVGEIVASTFAWAALVALLGAALGAAVLALRLQRRMDAIEGTMSRVSDGDLSARIPADGRSDDIGILSAQINRTLERLAGLFEGMKQVSGDIAHDLKTPLNRLRLTVQSAAAHHAEGLPVARELAQAEEESDRINATFDALLRIAQIEAGARKARFETLDLRGIAEHLAETYRDVAEDAGMSFRLDLGEGVAARVRGDRELLLQLGANLVENAITHCQPGTHIRVSLDTVPGAVALRVRDSGQGIPAAERENVLRRLYRLEKSRTTPGSGLGLSLVKAIAELHEATLSLSDAAPGLCVSVIFPKTKAG